MLSKLLLTEDQEEQSGGKPSGVYSKSRIKARTKQNLWNIKQERPELFEKKGDSSVEATEPACVVPPGFEACERAGWFHDPGKGIFLEAQSGRRLWFDAAANEYRDLHQGSVLPLVCNSGAARNCEAASPKSSPSSSAAGAKQALPRHIIIPDLHRTAKALQADIDHLDQPSAILAVFGVAEGVWAASTEAASVGLHEKLIRRLAAFRGAWSDEQLCEAVKGALEDHSQTQEEQSTASAPVLPLAAAALVVGRRIVSAAAPGTLARCVSSAAASGVASISGEHPQANPRLTAACHELADGSGEPLCIALLAGRAGLNHAETAAPVLPQLILGRPRAASIALLSAARQREAKGHLVAACVRLGPALQVEFGGPPLKRRKVEDAPSKIRMRQILLRHWRGEGAKPVDPVRRKSVLRSIEEAEAQMLAVLHTLTKDGPGGFSNACKTNSECESALKGGELAGDLGWLERGKGVDSKQANGRTVKSVIPAPVLRAAFELEVGQLGDVVSSDIGVHLLLRSA